MENIEIIRNKIIDWYRINRRELPWRNTQDPYKIWISEIILQQTRIVQGLDYYNRFIERFPDVHSLAIAEEQEVLKYWQGLGYYSRARNLHFTAQYIEKEYQGKFPRDYRQILALKGIGEYTAAAIGSFAFDLPYPAVDGNVFRVLSRLFLIEDPIDTNSGKKIFTNLADQLMDKNHPGLFNQAMMEFGALQCVPSSPDCAICPLLHHCSGFAQKRINDLPKKSQQTKTKTLFLHYFHIHYNGFIYLNKRKEKGIWQNLFEFPLIESENPLDFNDLVKNQSFENLFESTNPSQFQLILSKQKHVLSHRILFADFYQVTIENENELLKSFQKIRPEELEQYPIHRLMSIYLEKL